MMPRNSRTSFPLSVELCARAAEIEGLKNAESKTAVITNKKSAHGITETCVLLQSLLSINLRLPSTLNNRDRPCRGCPSFRDQSCCVVKSTFARDLVYSGIRFARAIHSVCDLLYCARR